MQTFSMRRVVSMVDRTWETIYPTFSSSLGSTLLLIEEATHDPLYLWDIRLPHVPQTSASLLLSRPARRPPSGFPPVYHFGFPLVWRDPALVLRFGWACGSPRARGCLWAVFGALMIRDQLGRIWDSALYFFGRKISAWSRASVAVDRIGLQMWVHVEFCSIRLRVRLGKWVGRCYLSAAHHWCAASTWHGSWCWATPSTPGLAHRSVPRAKVINMCSILDKHV
jgi:hypothetical protein